MGFIVMVLVGIGLSVSNANSWFAVPSFCIWICFGIAIVFAVISIINYISARSAYNKMSKRIRF